MIRFIRHSANSVKIAKMKRKARRQMTKHGFNIRKSKDGTVRISTAKTVWIVDILPRMSFEEKVEKVRWSLLNAGFTYSEEVEKLVEETLIM